MIDFDLSLPPLTIAPFEEYPTRSSTLRTCIDFATRDFITSDEADTTHVDPLVRLFDPNWPAALWYHEFSKVGDLPGKLHAKQLEALAFQSKHRWLFWGNQAGKTSFGAIDMSMMALGRHPLQLAGILKMPPFTGWASALTWELWEKIMLPELLSWIPAHRILEAPPAFKQSTRRDIIILADNGRESRITGKAAQQGSGSYQSARVNLIWLDEEHPESVWDEMQPRLLRFGGRTLATMTPLLGLSWVHARVYEPVKTGRITVDRHWYSHAGVADNPSIDKTAIADLTEELKHNPSQLESRLHGHFTRPTGAVLPWDPEKHTRPVNDDQLTIMRVRGAWFGALDLGKWRFAFAFGVSDTEGGFVFIDEYFDQSGDVDVRARGMHALLKRWKVPHDISIPADCADPKGIQELNEAFERIGSAYRVYAIDGALKSRQMGILRVESMLNRGALKVRRGMGADLVWSLGRNSSRNGIPQMGSRWMWEAANWQYPKTPDGKIQKDDPDDATADGADMMDLTRYLIVSFFPADAPTPGKRNPTRAERIAKEFEELDRMERAEDEEREQGGDRYGGVLRQ